LAPEEVKDTTPTEFAEQLRPSEIQPMLDAAARYNFIPRPVRAAEILPQTARG
jgi:hypothetical protein